jgi:hypothetical protein
VRPTRSASGSSAWDDAEERAYWQSFEDVLPKGLETYVSLESEATVISTFTTCLIPGLLQTADYGRALIRTESPTVRPTELERLVELLMARQELVTKAVNPLRLWAVLDEAVLHRLVGGPEVMCAQLHHLAKVSRLDNVDVQVLPLKPRNSVVLVRTIAKKPAVAT